MSKAIPEGWKRVRLGKYLQESKQRMEMDKDLPVLSVTNTQGFVLSEDFFDRQVYSKNRENYKRITKGQFAYNPSRLNVGSLSRLKNIEAGLISPMYVVFETLPELDAEFVAFWLTSNYTKNLIKTSTQGTVRDSVNYNVLAAFPIALPPLPEQHKIAAILGSVDKAIEKTRAVIEQTRSLKRAMMQELLTRGIPGRHKKFKKTPVGEIPEEWEVVKFEKAILSGPQNGLYRHESDYGNGTRIVRIDCFNDGKFYNTDFKRVNISENDIALYKVEFRDILINRVNSMSHLGKAAIFPMIDEPTVFESNMMRIRLDENMMLPEYAILWLCSRQIKKQIEDSAKKAIAQCSINQTDVKNFLFPCPSIGEQLGIVKAFTVMESFYNANVKQLEGKKTLKAALMNKLLTGEIRVKKED